MEGRKGGKKRKRKAMEEEVSLGLRQQAQLSRWIAKSGAKKKQKPATSYDNELKLCWQLQARQTCIQDKA